MVLKGVARLFTARSVAYWEVANSGGRLTLFGVLTSIHTHWTTSSPPGQFPSGGVSGRFYSLYFA